MSKRLLVHFTSSAKNLLMRYLSTHWSSRAQTIAVDSSHPIRGPEAAFRDSSPQGPELFDFSWWPSPINLEDVKKM